MDSKLVKEIVDCLPKERTLYHYYKDSYAVSLLRRALVKSGPQKLSQLRQTKYGKLLSKVVFKQLLATLGTGVLSSEHLDSLWPMDYENYVLTLGMWGNDKSYGWEQVSRPGANLVLQLNFSNQHDKIYRKKVLDDFSKFQYYGHPTSSSRCTMAWARIDLDFASNEALIEEVQTDWLRSIDWLKGRCKWAINNNLKSFYYYDQTLYVDNVLVYLKEVNRHQKIWSEAILNAALNFLVDEIGIGTIYYHSFETGAVLKNIGYSKPPKSLYTDLPKRFCFDKVKSGPEFIQRNKKAKRKLKTIRQQQWFSMAG